MKKSLYNTIIGKMDKFINKILAPTSSAWRKGKIPVIFKGILKSEGILVTEIARQMQPDPNKLHSELKSMTGHLKSECWDKDEEEAQKSFIRHMSGQEKDRLIILADTSDISKNYAEKMEYISRIRDASKSKEGPVISNGYHTFESYVTLDNTVAPLLNFPFSLEDTTTKSMNHAIRKGYKILRESLRDTPTLLVEDRGFDSSENYEMSHEFGHDVLVRQRGDRILFDANGSKIGNAMDIAQKMEFNNTTRLFVKRDDEKKGRKRFFEYDFKTVFLDDRGKLPYTFICVRHKDWTMFLLTSILVTNKYECEKLIRYYTLRWKAEESIRFVKSAINIESVRVWYFRAIRRLIMLAYWTMGFISLLQLELSENTLQKLIRLGKPRKNKVEFLFYRILRGLEFLLASSCLTLEVFL